MDDEMLIDLVKEHSCLYDKLDDNYCNYRMKDEIWATIVSSMHLNVETAAIKHHWKSLRDNYRDALKRKRERFSQKNWKYEKKMAFLQDHMTLRPKRHRRKQSPEGDIDADDTGDISRGAESASPESSPSSPSSSLVYQDPKQDPDPLEDPVKAKHPAKHPLFSFFDSMCSTTIKLPKEYQLEIKRKVFQVVTDAEEKAIASKADRHSQSNASAINYEPCSLKNELG